MQTNGPTTERLIEASYQKKAMAVEKLREGNLGGAKAIAYVAKFLYSELPGLRRLNAVIDVLIGYENKINGSVDWYAVLGVHPTETLTNIRKRYRKLFLDMAMDDDDSLDITYRANKILTDSWKFLCNVKGRELYDKRRRYQLREKDRRLRSFAFKSVVLKPAPRPLYYDEHMVQLSGERMGGGRGVRKGEASTSTNVPPANKRRKIRPESPPARQRMMSDIVPPAGRVAVLTGFIKEELQRENLVNIPKEEAVNGVEGNRIIIEIDDDDDEKMD